MDKSLPVGLGDEQRLTQVLLNLVGNAIKSTDRGGGEHRRGRAEWPFRRLGNRHRAWHTLDQQDRIFDQFHQVDSSLTKAKGGTGLAIAKQIVEMHGGRIWVVSTPGQRIDVSDGTPHARRIPKARPGQLGMLRKITATFQLSFET